jgi:hypothetical protein
MHDLHEAGLRGVAGVSTSTDVLLWNTGSPVNSVAVCSHHAVCSGRSLFCRAASSDSKRARAIGLPPSRFIKAADPTLMRLNLTLLLCVAAPVHLNAWSGGRRPLG